MYMHHHPVAYILLDCGSLPLDYLNHVFTLLTDLLVDSEIDCREYRDDSELSQCCVNIAHNLAPSSPHPLQLFWVTDGCPDLATSESSIAVLYLQAIMRQSSRASCRSFIVSREGGGSNNNQMCSLLLGAPIVSPSQLSSTVPTDYWLSGYVAVDDRDLEILCRPAVRLSLPPDPVFVLLGTVPDGSSSLVPYLESDFEAALQGDMTDLEQRPAVLECQHLLYLIDPLDHSNCWRMRRFEHCYRNCVLSKLQSRKSASVDHQDDELTPPSQPSGSQCQPSIRDTNKAALKKCLLMALRRAGIPRSSPDFAAAWKHVYCGCVFSLRKKLDRVLIDSNALISIVQSTMRSCNII